MFSHNPEGVAFFRRIMPSVSTLLSVATHRLRDLCFKNKPDRYTMKQDARNKIQIVPDTTGRRLHNKFTRGEPLLPKERQQLESWYVRQDAIENEALSFSAGGGKIAALRAQLDAAQARLIMDMQNIQKITLENEALRKENAVLRRKLMRRQKTNPE